MLQNATHSTRFRLTGLVAGSTLAITAALVATPAAHATGDPNRYASPKGTGGGGCTKKDPCSIVTAINDAHAADTVVLLPGTYNNVATRLTDNGENLTIEGAPNEPFPVVESTAASGGMTLTGASTLSHFEFDDALSHVNAIVGFTSTYTHLIVRVTGVGSTAIVTHGDVLDSLLVATNTAGVALLEAIPVSSVDSSDTATVQNVTAEAPGASADGMFAEDNSLAQLTVDAKNDIFHGDDDDIVASSDGYESTTVNVDVSYSDYANGSELAGLGEANINFDQSDTRTAPRFRAAAKYDFREAAGSATIDAGTSGGVTAKTDLEGFPRTLGSSTDMGAYEFADKAELKNLSVVKVGDHDARLTVEVEPEGFTTDVRVIATHGGDRIPSHKVTVEDSVGTKKVTLILDGLKKKTNYEVQAVGVNASGRYYSKQESLKTK